MGVVYRDLAAEHLPALRQLLIPHWKRDWTAEVADRFLRWRLFERSEWDALVAFDGERCVAFIDSFVRPYALGGQRVRVRETGEWLCLPEYRPLVSLRVLQSLMARPEPMLATTSSEVTKAVLPRLRWKVVGRLQQYVFPAGVGAIAKGMAQGLRTTLEALPSSTGRLLRFRLRKPRRLPPPDQPASVTEIGSADELPDVRPPAGAFALCALVDRHEARWFGAAPRGEGEFLWLRFERRDETVGLSMSRLYHEGPYRGAKLLHVQASRHDRATYAWLVSETSRRLAERGAHWIDARFTCAEIADALEAVGYLRMNAWPVYWWARDRLALDGAILVSGMRGEEGLVPYPP